MSDDDERSGLFDLDRFVQAQNEGGTYERALAELRAGRKQTHWMWFVFPQIAGLGHSPTAKAYALSGLAEARAYLAHPVLGPRLVECANTVLARPGATAAEVFGPVDAQKLHSSATLFARADPGQAVFGDLLTTFFGAREDEGTTSRL